jgi:hypothetical protein
VHTYQIHSNRISSGDSQTPLHLPLGINNYTSELNSRDATGFYQLPPVVLRYSRPVSYISTGESRYFWPNCRSLRRSRVVRPSPVSTAMSVTSALLIFRSTCLPSIPLIRLSSPRSWTHNIHSLGLDPPTRKQKNGKPKNRIPCILPKCRSNRGLSTLSVEALNIKNPWPRLYNSDPRPCPSTPSGENTAGDHPNLSLPHLV